MFKDLDYIIKLQIIDNKIKDHTSEKNICLAAIKTLKEKEENIKFLKIKIKRKIQKLTEKMHQREEILEDHKRLHGQKEIDLDDDKKTKKEHIKREVSKLEMAIEVYEKKIIEVKDSLSEQDRKIDLKDQELSEIKEDIELQESKLNDIQNSIDDKMAQLLQDREQIISSVRGPFLSHYERILNIRNGVAITYVTEDSLCRECRLQIPVHIQQKINRMDDYYTCEGCGRILVNKDALEVKDE